MMVEYIMNYNASINFKYNICMTVTPQLLFVLCGLVVRVPGYRSRDPGFDSWHYQIFLRSSGS
jgi:hypothetical protein